MSLSKEDLKVGPFYISGDELVAQVIYEAIKCKEYPTVPRKTAMIVRRVTELYKREFERISDVCYCKIFANYEELLTWLKENIITIPEIEELNLTPKEYKAGIKMNDESRRQYYITYTGAPARPKEDDFVDLSAYYRNLCHDLIRSCIEINFSALMENNKEGQ